MERRSRDETVGRHVSTPDRRDTDASGCIQDEERSPKG